MKTVFYFHPGLLGSVALFYVLARYRFPLAPVLMLIAAGGVAGIRRPRREIVIAATAALVTIAFAHLPLYNSRTARATNYLAIAIALDKDPARSDGAADFYRRSLDTDPRFPAAQFGLGTHLLRAGHATEAIPHYEAALSVWPDYEEAHYNLGRALAMTGDAPQAIEHYQEALRIRPDDEDAEMGIAASLLSLDRMDEGIRHLGRALELNPSDAAAHNTLGAALANEGHIAEAFSHFERAAALNPTDENTRRNLESARQMLPKGK
jgi:tetratricopeptide (TPR) repeat protein